MSDMQPLLNDHPLMIWWNEYKNSDDFKNSKNWVVNPKHTEGSLWVAFLAGWQAAAEHLRI